MLAYQLTSCPLAKLKTTVRGRFVYASDRRPRSAVGRRRQRKARGHPVCRCRHLRKIRGWEQRRPHHHRANRPRTCPNDLRIPSPTKRCAPIPPLSSFTTQPEIDSSFPISRRSYRTCQPSRYGHHWLWRRRACPIFL